MKCPLETGGTSNDESTQIQPLEGFTINQQLLAFKFSRRRSAASAGGKSCQSVCLYLCVR